MVQPENRVKCRHVDDAHVAIVAPANSTVDDIVNRLDAVLGVRVADPGFVAELVVIRILGQEGIETVMESRSPALHIAAGRVLIAARIDVGITVGPSESLIPLGELAELLLGYRKAV